MMFNKNYYLRTRRDHCSLIIEDHNSLMKVGPPKKFKLKKVQSQEISKLRNFYVGKSLSPESCLYSTINQ